MKQPVVGVMPLWDEDRDSLWMLPGYLDGIMAAGGLPVIFPFTADETKLDRLLGLCDGVLLTGGHDVSPTLYGEQPLKGLVCSSRMRDDMETVVLQKAMAADLPILGICRGIQFINAALGGTLYQDLPAQHPSAVVHKQNPPYDQPAHEVRLFRDSPMQRCLKAETIGVNSYHHQAVKELAPGLEIMAEAPDGIVEALCAPDARFLWAVQWHPEFSWRTDPNSIKIFQAFVEAMK